MRQFSLLHDEIALLEKHLHAWPRSNEASRRLETIPGIGPITASALVASISDPHLFRSGRELAAWIELVPRQSSTGGKDRLGRISKQGDQYLRWLLVAGAMSVIRQARHKDPGTMPWLAQMIATEPAKVAAGTGQQDRPHRLGVVVPWRNLSEAGGGSGSVGEKEQVQQFGGVRET